MNHLIHKRKIITRATILIIIGCLAFFFITIVTTTGYIDIQQKEVIDGKYYIYVDNKYNGRTNICQIECTRAEYDKVICDKNLTYKISYKSSKLFPNRGKLIYLNFNNIIDNRE